jgi:hypothetical protein
MSGGAPPSFTPPQVAGFPIREPPLYYPTATPKATIRAMISQLSNVEVAFTHGKQRMMGMSGKKAWIYLTIQNIKALGYDEERTQANALDPTQLDYNLCGQRVITVTCRCESVDESIEPYDILERVRWSQRSDLGRTLRDQAGLAIASYGDIIHLGHQELDNASVRVATMDLIFNRALNATEPGTTPQTIDTVDGGTQAPGTPFTIPGPGDQAAAPAPPPVPDFEGGTALVPLGFGQTVGP